MPDEIPDDIKQAATRVAGNFLAFDVSCDAIYRDVARALMAEREANARIVVSRMPATQCTRDDKICAALERAAAAIRKGTPHA